MRARVPLVLALLGALQGIMPIALAQVPVSQFAVGGMHACAVTRAGALKCWGSNTSGQLGIGSVSAGQGLPVDVPSLQSGVVDVVAGGAHTCALLADGRVKCWGYNFSGQVGIGRDGNDLMYVPTPTDVIDDAASISAGYSGTCAVTRGGRLLCWGIDGGPGSGVGLFGHATPYDHDLKTGVVAVATDSSNTCVLVASGAVKCWGYSPTRPSTLVPTDVPGLRPGVVAISTNCALHVDGTLSCWNDDRQPVAPIPGTASGVARLARTGNNPACLITTAGGAKCWGYNYYGALGDGTTVDRSSAVDVVGLASGVASIATNGTATNTCALSTAGNLWCWGSNTAGQIGDGTTLPRLTPTPVNGLSTHEVPGALPPVSYQGLWIGTPAERESGWGINFVHQGGKLFATWFVYDIDGSGLWWVMPNGWHSGGGPHYFTGDLYHTRGPAFDAVPFRPIGPGDYTRVGWMSVDFSDAEHARVFYEVDRILYSRQIARFLFASPPPTCTLGGSPGAAPNYSGLWLNPAESGWGVNVTHQGDKLFVTWFTYEASGKGMWLVMSSGTNTAPGQYSGELHRTTGPSYRGAYDSGRVSWTTVGSATFTFSDATNGTFAYRVNGVEQSKAITRFSFDSPATVCR